MEIHGMHIDKLQLLTSLDTIKNIVQDAQDSIQFCSSHFQKSADEVGFTNDDLMQSIDECEIFINDALEEIEQLIYQVEETDEI